MTADAILNFLIFGITFYLIARYARQDGKWALKRLKTVFRFFTCQSNVFCAAAALLTGVFLLAGGVPEWVRTLKYIGTAAVTITMLTVFLFLWPSFGRDSLKQLLSGPDLFMHLITPVLAIVSFCFPERQGMTFAQALWGLLPVAAYGPYYLYRIRFAPEEKRWDDFYGFNKQGKWPVAFGIMAAGSFALCMVFMLVSNS